MKKNPVGRPLKYTGKYLQEIKKKFEKYIKENDIPIIAEFAYKNDIPRQKLYEFEELNDTIKRCIDKKETNLEKGVLSGKLNAAMGIFSLKQLGWSDKQEILNQGSIELKITREIKTKGECE